MPPLIYFSPELMLLPPFEVVFGDNYEPRRLLLVPIPSPISCASVDVRVQIFVAEKRAKQAQWRSPAPPHTRPRHVAAPGRARAHLPPIEAPVPSSPWRTTTGDLACATVSVVFGDLASGERLRVLSYFFPTRIQSQNLS